MAGLIPFNKKLDHLDNYHNFIDDFFNDIMPSRFFDNDNFKIDVKDCKKEFLIEAELPGVNKNDVDIELNDNRLTIKVEREEEKRNEKDNYIHRERRFGSMQRSMYLEDIDPEGIKAKFDNGLLRINIPKIEKKENKYRIDIN